MISAGKSFKIGEIVILVIYSFGWIYLSKSGWLTIDRLLVYDKSFLINDCLSNADKELYETKDIFCFF